MIKSIVVALAMSVTCASAADLLDVSELVQQKQSWGKWASEKRTLSVEGRFATRAGKLLRLQKCELTFRATNGLRLPRLHNGRNVEVIGYLKRVDSKIEFIIQRLAEGDSDLERYKERRRRLPQDKPAAWYELAGQIKARAEFYDDADLLSESRSIRDRGFQIERSSIKPGDFETLRRLAARGSEFDLSVGIQNAMSHEALRWQWNALRENKKTTRKQYSAFVAQLEELKGATQPTRVEKKGLRTSYERNPVGEYEKATLADRLLIHRYFYREALLPLILKNAKADGSNGVEIARLIRTNIPEEATLANEYEAGELKFAIRNAVNMSRADMLDLVDRLERTNQAALAADTKRRWVLASEQRLSKRGPSGLVQAAVEFDSLLGDRAKATMLLKQAWEQSSEKTEIEDRLAKFDIYRHKSRWLTKAEKDALPESQMEQALRESRIIAGMNRDQVRKVLGKPKRISRFAARSRVQIVWVFDDATGHRISVLFERKSGSAEDRTRVISVSTLPGK